MADLRALLIVLALAAAAASTLATTIKAGPAGDGPKPSGESWKWIFSEEFSTRTLNREKWATCYWWNDNGCTNLANKELEWYLPGNAEVAAGHLRLTARPETVVGYKGRTFKFTSGMVTTGVEYRELPRSPRFAFRYGHIEIRAKLPAGKGLWPALWLLPADRQSRPEIDIMEMLGDATGLLELHFHYVDGSGRKRDTGTEVKTHDLTNGWHVFGLRWEPETIVWYLDGVETWRYSDPANIPDEPMYLLMNLAVGGTWPGEPDRNTKFPAVMLVDYVRIWQRASP